MITQAQSAVGNTYGLLTVLNVTHKRPYHIDCRCSCGTVCSRQAFRVVTGYVTSCGHEHSITRFLGTKFGKLTLTRFLDKASSRSLAECQCDCGKTWTGHFGNLYNGLTKSCGCIEKPSGYHVSPSALMSLVHSARTRSKLTPRQISNIIKSKKTQQQLADQYGVTQSTISRIRNKVIWQPIEAIMKKKYEQEKEAQEKKDL